MMLEGAADDDWARAAHSLFIEGICFGYDFILCPAYLLHLNPIIETYALLQSIAFFHMVIYIGYFIGGITAILLRKRKSERLDPYLLTLSPILFILWALCANESMLVIIKLLQGSIVGYFGQGSFPIFNASFKHIIFTTGVIVSLLIICSCYNTKKSFTYSSQWSGFLIASLCLFIGIIQYFLHIIRSSTKTALRVPIRKGPGATPSDPIPRPLDLEINNNSENITSSDIPLRYIKGCGKDAATRWRQTLEWREINHIDTLLLEQQPHFDLMRECYPAFFHGRSKEGDPVSYELLGRIDIGRLKANGVDKNILLRHYLFVTEYLWNKIVADDNGKVVTVMDIKGVGIYDLMGDALDFIKLASSRIQLHYPERCSKMFIINAPMLFNILWRVISPMIHENTRKKITILGDDKSEMLKYIDVKELPSEYGGLHPLGSCRLELGLRDYVRSIAPGQSLFNVLAPASRRSGDVCVLSTGSDKEPWLSHDDDVATDSGASESSESEEDEWERLSSWTAAAARSMYAPSISSMGAMRERFGVSAVDVEQQAERSRLGCKSSQAHLGQENAFVYDAVSKRWVLDDPTSDSEALLDVSEREIVRAIEAAHVRWVRPKKEWRKCDRHFAYLAGLYFAWRVQLAAIMLCIPILLLLPLLKGGFGMKIRHISTIVIVAHLLQLLTLLAPHVMKTQKWIEDPKNGTIVLFRNISQMLGISLGIIGFNIVVNRDIPLGKTLTYLMLSLCIYVISSTQITCSLGVTSLFSLSHMPHIFINFILHAADGLGGCIALVIMSSLFGDAGVSKYNSYMCAPFVIGAMTNLGIAYLSLHFNYPPYLSANYIVPPL